MPRPKLLLADDSIAIRKVVELTFADEGIDVFSVPDAVSAMQKFVEVQPDIVLVDVGLEGTNGYQISEMIKQDESTRHIPVLLLVGSFEPFDQDAAERSGADGFLTKPFQSIRELVNKVFELVGTEGSETSTSIDLQEPGPASQVPQGEHSNVIPMPTADTDDIDNLINSSFSQTMEIEEFDTVEDLFSDEGLDDELIETIHLESPVDDTAPTIAFSMPPNLQGSDGLELGRMEDIPTEAAPEETAPSLETGLYPGQDIPEVSSTGIIANDPAAETKEFDWSPAAKIEDESGVSFGVEPPTLNGDSVYQTVPTEPEPTVLSLNRDQGAHEAAAPTGHQSEDHVFPEVSEATREPSAELIAVITQRVIERLSDKVVREVAQEAVPRIAEKLIREALEEEAKR